MNRKANVAAHSVFALAILALSLALVVTPATAQIASTANDPAIVHNTWSSGAAMPLAVKFTMAGVLKNKIYVVGGVTSSAIVANNQIYDPVANSWSVGAALPTITFGAATAVVGNTLYIFGGSTNNVNETNAVWAYNPKSNKWTAKAAMPTARVVATAVADKNIIYVIGGYNFTFGHGGLLNIVESYNTQTNTWTTEAPLLTWKSESSVGLVGSTILAAGGGTGTGDTGENEGYSVLTNSWTTLASDPMGRNASCGGYAGKLIVAGGGNNSAIAVNTNESFSLTKNKWTTLAPMPQAVADPGSAIYKGSLYCFGGGSVVGQFAGSVFNYVQKYQP
jgi:hypothetical protein